MASLSQTPPPGLADTNKPTKQGWHLVSFTNGDFAVVRWNGKSWVWGSLGAPSAAVNAFSYLGPTIASINSGSIVQRAVTALGGDLRSAGSAESIITNALDKGNLQQGRPVAFTPNRQGGYNAVGNSGQNWGDANPVNIIPSPIPATAGNTNLSLPDTIGGIFSWLTTASNWLRILEFAGGAVLIYTALKALTGVNTPSLAGVAKVIK